MSEAGALERLREQGEAKARSARLRALAVPEALWIVHPGRNEGTRRAVAERLRRPTRDLVPVAVAQGGLT